MHLQSWLILTIWHPALCHLFLFSLIDLSWEPVFCFSHERQSPFQLKVKRLVWPNSVLVCTAYRWCRVASLVYTWNQTNLTINWENCWALKLYVCSTRVLDGKPAILAIFDGKDFWNRRLWQEWILLLLLKNWTVIFVVFTTSYEMP